MNSLPSAMHYALWTRTLVQERETGFSTALGNLPNTRAFSYHLLKPSRYDFIS